MSEVYPPTRQPQSIRTPVSRSSLGPAGPPCGSALEGPNCTSPPPGAPRCSISRDNACDTWTSVALDALDLERWANNRRRARDRQEQGDQPLAPPRVVAGEVLVVGAGGRDEEVEAARLELAPGPLEAAGEDFRGEGGLLEGGQAVGWTGGRSLRCIR